MCIRKAGIALLLLCPSLISVGQSVSTLMGARAKGLGNTSACLADEWSLFNNPAGLAGLSKGALGIAYDMTPNLPGSQRMVATASFPAFQGTLAAGAFRFGDQLYSEHIATVGYANKFGLASLGARLNLVQYNAEGFGTRSVVSFNLGGIAELTPRLKIGAHIINVNQPVVSENNGERLPTKLIAGLVFTPQENLLLAVEVEKDIEFKATWKTGIEYKVFRKACLRTGFNLFPEAAFFGVGFRSARIILDYSMAYSVFLGTSHQVSAAYPLLSK